MKRFAYYIACYTLVVLCACTHDDTDDVIPAGNGKITIQASLDDMAITRADVKDTQAERKITHIDVFAVDSDGNIDYYERNTAGNNNGANDEDGSGVLTLNVARRAKSGSDFVFAQDEEYKFYLVANATAAKSEMEAIKTLAALQQLVQNDSFIPNKTGWTGGEQTLLHLTGTTGLGVNPDKKVPETFLMDAVATDAQSNDAFVVNSSEGNLTNLNLSAEFKRAAAKIIVNITQGEDVEFRIEMIETNGTSQTSQYDFIELPASTFVLPSDENLVGIKRVNTNPMVPNKQTFVWASEEPAATNSIQVVGYAYAHFWDNANLKNETSLILNIPMMWNRDDNLNTGYADNLGNNGKEAAAPRSWYKVPLSKDKKFERNKCYVVNVTINAVGAANRSTAIELENIEYKTLDWVAVDINVGDDVNRPAYLELNTDLVEIYNANFDNTSLSFSSSSAITSVTLKDVYRQNADGTFTSATDSYYAYYINKFGVKTNLSETIKAMISATAQPDVLNGNIAILSPIDNTTESEREKALAALGETPTVPDEPDVTGKPNPTDYLGANDIYPTTLPNASKEYENKTYIIYRYNETTGTFQSNTYECRKRKNSNNFYWNDGDGWINVDAPEEYNKALNSWLASHPEYQEYLNAIAQYNAYQAALTAIQNSGTSGDTHYNTIRYLEFEVENEQGLTATFRVMQYPVIYVVNIEGFFSYRSDFYHSSGTEAPHWQNRVAPYCYRAYWASYTIQRRSGNSGSWTNVETGYGPIYYNGSNYYCSRGQLNNYQITYAGNDGYNYLIEYESKGQVFQSRVVNSVYTSGNNTGKSKIYGYYNSSNKWNSAVYLGNSEIGRDPGNHRMYHVRVTATSDDYTAGRPRILNDNGEATDDVENGYTDNSLDNSKIVSPSFMTASQLGMTSGVSGLTIDQLYERAKDQCKNYVETYKDSSGTVIHLKDWRLPTKAEIDIIVQLQAKTEGAVDLVLAGQYYMCASPTKYTNGAANSSTNGYFIRCVRDAYDNE